MIKAKKFPGENTGGGEKPWRGDGITAATGIDKVIIWFKKNGPTRGGTTRSSREENTGPGR